MYLQCPYGISCSSEGICMPNERKQMLESDRSVMSDREREEEELERLFGNVFDLEDIAMAADNDL